MYWYKPLAKYFSVTGVALLLCCGYACKPEIKETGAELKFFDVKQYFKDEAEKLSRSNPAIFKTVTHNGKTESKKVLIDNWGRELNSFTESDINKPAWKLSYSVDSSANGITYRAKDASLKTHEISIKKDSGKVTAIIIQNSTHNILYNTTEKLSYFPGSYYLIEKTQKVKVMGANSYQIKGKFN